MKTQIIFTSIFFICWHTHAQIGTEPQQQPAQTQQSAIIQQPSETDYLKQQLIDLTDKISTIQQDIKKVNTPQDKTNLLVQIENRQIESVRLSGSFVERFAQGTKATETILSALETGASIGELSSPFISPTFQKKYDNWIDRWGKFVPAAILPTIALSLKGLNNDQKLASIPIGISITGMISGLNKNENNRTKAIEKSIHDFQSTLDLFDLNRMVYSDVQKLKAYINSANNADSTLSNDFINFWSGNKDLFLKSDVDIKSDDRYKKYINEAQNYMSRFQVKLSKVQFVLDHVESMLKSYYERNFIKNYHIESAPKIQTETKIALDKLYQTYSNFKSHWNELQGKFYQITPDELRKLDSYYQLENLKLQAGAK